MKKLLTILFLLTFIQVKSQIPAWEWARCPTGGGVGSGWEESYSIASDHSGNVYLSGFFNDTSLIIGSYTFSSVGNNDILIAKYDSSGNVIWATSVGGIGVDECNSITVDDSENIYVTGEFNSATISFGTYSLTNSGVGTNIFIAKYDSSGTVVWAKSGKGTGTNLSKSVTVDSWGNSYITGYYNSPILIFDADTLTKTGAGFTDAFIVKYNPTGNILWTKNIGDTLAEFSSCIVANNSGDIYITGSFSSPTLSFDTISVSNVGSSAMFLAKLDSFGNAIWAKSFNSIGNNETFFVTADAFGNSYLTGRFISPILVFASDTLHNTGMYDCFFTKFNSAGNILWAKSSVGSGNDFGSSIVVDSIGNSYLAGGFYSPTLTFDTIVLQFPANGFDPMFIVKYDSSGNTLWGKAIASGGDDQNSIALGLNGSIYVGGDFYNVNPFILGCDTLIRTASEVLFVAKLGRNLCPDSTPRVNEINQNISETIFPNPFSDNLNVTVNENEQSQIILYDILSRKLLQQTFTNSTTLNTEQLANGIYIYELRTMNGVIKKGKIIKQ